MLDDRPAKSGLNHPLLIWSPSINSISTMPDGSLSISRPPGTRLLVSASPRQLIERWWFHSLTPDEVETIGVQWTKSCKLGALYVKCLAHLFPKWGKTHCMISGSSGNGTESL